MNKLTALLYLQNAEAPSAIDLRDQAIKTFVAIISSEDFNDALDSVLVSQVEAYVAMREGDGKETATASGGEIEKVFRQAALNGFREHFPDAHENSESYSWWLDGMSYDYAWPVSIMKNFGYLAGYRDGVVAKQLQAYAANQLV